MGSTTGGPLLPPPSALCWGHLVGDEKEKRGDIPLPTSRGLGSAGGRAGSVHMAARTLLSGYSTLRLLTSAKPDSQQCWGGRSSGPRATLGAWLALPSHLQGPPVYPGLHLLSLRSRNCISVERGRREGEEVRGGRVEWRRGERKGRGLEEEVGGQEMQRREKEGKGDPGRDGYSTEAMLRP